MTLIVRRFGFLLANMIVFTVGVATGAAIMLIWLSNQP